MTISKVRININIGRKKSTKNGKMDAVIWETVQL